MTQACWYSNSQCAITTFFCVVASYQTLTAIRVMEVMKMTVTLLSQHIHSRQEEVRVLATTK